MGKNKNRGERTGQQHGRHAAGTPAEDTQKSTVPQEQQTMPVPGSEQHVSHKRGKKFGHN